MLYEVEAMNAIKNEIKEIINYYEHRMDRLGDSKKHEKDPLTVASLEGRIYEMSDFRFSLYRLMEKILEVEEESNAN